MIPLGRGSTPADVANACCYLASDEAAFVSARRTKWRDGHGIGTEALEDGHGWKKDRCPLSQSNYRLVHTHGIGHGIGNSEEYEEHLSHCDCPLRESYHSRNSSAIYAAPMQESKDCQGASGP